MEIARDLDRSADELTVLRAEDMIRSLDGIEAVRIVPGARRPVDELHLVVTPARDPKQTVRDVHSLLAASFDLDIDRRVISVVQLPADTGQRLQAGRPRLVLDAVQLEVRGGETSVTVRLTHGDADVRGCAGPVGADAVATATADAVLDALTDRVDDVRLRTVGAEVVQVGPARIAVALVEASSGRHREELCGSAAVRSSEPDAIARAVLDATNRLHRD